MLTAFLVALSFVNAAPATKTVTSADAGKTITIAKHQKLNVELSECGSCGYKWKTTRKPNATVLTRRSQIRKDSTCEEPCAGGSYTTVFRYTGKAAGRTTLRLEYFGPGKADASDTFQITIRVR